MEKINKINIINLGFNNQEKIIFEYIKNVIKYKGNLIIDDSNFYILKEIGIITQKKDTIYINNIATSKSKLLYNKLEKYTNNNDFRSGILNYHKHLKNKLIYNNYYLILNELKINLNDISNKNIKNIILCHCDINKLYIQSKYIKELYCSGIYLHYLYLNCRKLKVLDCRYNYLSNLNLNKCKNIQFIYGSINNITNVNFNKCNKIISFLMNNNLISNIQFINLPIKSIQLHNNKIIDFQILNCYYVEEMNLINNNISNITLKNIYYLNEIYLSKNPIQYKGINLINVGNNNLNLIIDFDYNKKPEDKINKVSSILKMSYSFHPSYVNNEINLISDNDFKLNIDNFILLEPNKSNIHLTKEFNNWKDYKEFHNFMNEFI